MKDIEIRSEYIFEHVFITYFLEEISFETAVELMSFRVIELALAIHLTVTEGTFVLMTLWPIEFALTIHNVSVESTSISATIGKDRRALTMLAISLPGPFVFCHDAIVVSLAIIELESMPMSYHFKLFNSCLSLEGLNLGFISWHTGFDKLSIRLAEIGNFTIVHRSICLVPKTFVAWLCVFCFF